MLSYYINYWTILGLMALESSFIPFPSEVIMIPAGYLVGTERLSFTPCWLMSILGSIIGSLVNYYIAKTLGFKLLHKYGKYFFLSESKLAKIEKFFLTHGSVSTFTGRLIPVIRQYISFPAGLSHMRLNKFIFFTTLGAGLWSAILIVLGFTLGHNQALVKEKLHTITIVLILFVIIILLIYIIYYKQKSVKRSNN